MCFQVAEFEIETYIFQDNKVFCRMAIFIRSVSLRNSPQDIDVITGIKTTRSFADSNLKVLLV